MYFCDKFVKAYYDLMNKLFCTSFHLSSLRPFMSVNFFIRQLLGSIITVCLISTAAAGSPLWILTPLTATTLSVPSNETAIVQYQVTNQSTKIHTLTMQSIPGITQLTTGLGVCRNPFVLRGKTSCVLSVQVNGSQLMRPINDGPIVCEQGSTLQCYRPASTDLLHLTQAPAITTATISVINSPLTLTTNGPAGSLTINNTSQVVAATNITSNFTGTALDGNVTETANTCSNVAPQSSCTLTYAAGSTAVPLTNFVIEGSNTNAVSAAMQIDQGIAINVVSPPSGSAAGGLAITLTGTGFTGATSVTFGGVPATSVNVVNSTSITAITPRHSPGVVDVVITTPSGSAAAINGFTYDATAVGQPAYGGTIACLNSGNNLIAATADNSVGIVWGGMNNSTNATSNTDGAENTEEIVSILGLNNGVPYAAQLCADYSIDSQGNSPCPSSSGNACYDDWFLPAGNNSLSSGQLNCLYDNRVAIGGFADTYYWSSSESDADNAWYQDFDPVSMGMGDKYFTYHVRCVRAFVP